MLAAAVLFVAAVVTWQYWFAGSRNTNGPPAPEADAVAAEPRMPSAVVGETIEQAESDTGVSDTGSADEPGDSEPHTAYAAIDQTSAVDADFPDYLQHMLDGPFSLHAIPAPEGCTAIADVLEEMRLETRDALWADRVEAELRAIWTSTGRKPLPLSVSCRSTICQVSAIGQVSDDVGSNYQTARGAFGSSDLATEFSSMRQVSARRSFGGGEARPVAVWVLTSNGNSAPGEEPHCVSALFSD